MWAYIIMDVHLAEDRLPIFGNMDFVGMFLPSETIIALVSQPIFSSVVYNYLCWL